MQWPLWHTIAPLMYSKFLCQPIISRYLIIISQWFPGAEFSKNTSNKPIRETGKPLHGIIRKTGEYVKGPNIYNIHVKIRETGQCASWTNKAFRIVVRCSFVFANNNYSWVKEITWFISANSSWCLQEQKWRSNYNSKGYIRELGVLARLFPVCFPVVGFLTGLWE